MSEDTVRHLRGAVQDQAVIERYWSHIQTGPADHCWLWTGAISGKGHGRFQIADDHVTGLDGSVRRPAHSW